MKKITVLFLFTLLLASCVPSVSRTEHHKYCSFKMPGYVHLAPVTNTAFNKENYFKFNSSRSSSMLQIFVYNTEIDLDEKIAGQEDAINKPDIFTAAATVPVNHFGRYTGKGIAMTGDYSGGLVHGKIVIFAYSGKNRGFVAIYQHIPENANDFDSVVNSFKIRDRG